MTDFLPIARELLATMPMYPGEILRTPDAQLDPYTLAKKRRLLELRALADIQRRAEEAMRATGGDKQAALRLMLGEGK